MFKLVVLSAFVAIVAAKPHGVSLASVIPSAISHQSRTDIISSPVVSAYAAPVHVAAAAPVVHHNTLVAAGPAVHKTVVSSVPAVAYAAVPVTGTAYSQNVHYAQKDVVTGYNSQVLKPNLGSLATPIDIVSKSNILAPARAVQTLTPTVTQVEPQVTIKKVTVDVPVHTPVVSEVEVRTPHVVAQPAVAAVQAYSVAAPATSYAYNAPVVSGYSVAAPAVSSYSVAAPAVSSYSVAAPAVSSYSVAAPAVSSYSVSAPAVSSYSVSAPAVSGYSVSAPAISSYSVAAPALVSSHGVNSKVVHGYSTGVLSGASAYAVNAPIVHGYSAGVLSAPSGISTTEVRQAPSPLYTQAKLQAW